MTNMDRIRKLILFIDATLMTFLIGIIAVGIFSMIAGCAQYKAGGTIVTIGEEVMLPEITEPESGLALRVYESIHGARIWSRENNRTDVVYTNHYTTSYFGIVSKEDDTILSVTVLPTNESEKTQDVSLTRPD